MQTHPTKIMEGLYIGGIFPTLKNFIKTRHIDAVVNLSGVTKNYGDFVKVLKIDIRDNEKENIIQYFDICNKFIIKYLNNGKNIYIHCMCGVS